MFKEDILIFYSVAQGRDWWWVLVNMVMNLWLP
jgi:hypothetical protein